MLNSDKYVLADLWLYMVAFFSLYSFFCFFKNSFWVSYHVAQMGPNSIHLSLHMHPLPLKDPSKKSKIKKNSTKLNKIKKKKSLVVEAVV